MQTLLQDQKYQETRSECLFCPNKPALCVDPCFRVFHQNLGMFQEELAFSSEDEQFAFKKYILYFGSVIF